MRVITYEQLAAKRACQEQLQKFRDFFGSEVEVTEEVAAKHAIDFDFDWAARNLLTASAREEYERVRDAAREEYDHITAPAREEYDRITAPAREEYDRIMTTAREEYDRITAPAREEYDRAEAVTFARLYLQSS